MAEICCECECLAVNISCVCSFDGINEFRLQIRIAGTQVHRVAVVGKWVLLPKIWTVDAAAVAQLYFVIGVEFSRNMQARK